VLLTIANVTDDWTTDEGLAAGMLQWGPVERASIVRNPAGDSKEYGLVEFKLPAAAAACKARLDELKVRLGPSLPACLGRFPLRASCARAVLAWCGGECGGGRGVVLMRARAQEASLAQQKDTRSQLTRRMRDAAAAKAAAERAISTSSTAPAAAEAAPPADAAPGAAAPAGEVRAPQERESCRLCADSTCADRARAAGHQNRGG